MVFFLFAAILQDHVHCRMFWLESALGLGRNALPAFGGAIIWLKQAICLWYSRRRCPCSCYSYFCLYPVAPLALSNTDRGNWVGGAGGCFCSLGGCHNCQVQLLIALQCSSIQHQMVLKAKMTTMFLEYSFE